MKNGKNEKICFFEHCLIVGYFVFLAIGEIWRFCSMGFYLSVVGVVAICCGGLFLVSGSVNCLGMEVKCREKLELFYCLS